MQKINNDKNSNNQNININDENVILSLTDWDQYFMTMAYLVSMKSKDPSTRVGAVIVGRDNEIISTGYNGFPRKILDKYKRYHNREYKYIAANHAEENAIIQCAKLGISTKNCTIYTPWIPCGQCSKIIIQCGIVKVVYDKNFPGNCAEKTENWEYSINISKEILLEAEIEVVEFDKKLIKIQGLYKEKNFDIL